MRKSVLIYIFCLLLICETSIAQLQENIIILDAMETAKIALSNNFDIQIYKLDNSISEEDLLKSYSIYDTEITGEYEYDEKRLTRATTILGSRETSVSQDLTLEKKLPTGTILSLGASHSRDFTDSVFATLNPYHEATAELSVTQPLLKDFLGIQDRNSIKITELDIDSSIYTSMGKIEEQIAKAQKAYWKLVIVYHEIGIREQILSNAEQLESVTESNFGLGAVEEAELFAVKANVKERRRGLVLTRNRLDAALNDLRLQLNLPKHIDIIPKDEPEIKDHIFNFTKSIATALKNRRDYKVARNDVKSQDLSLQMKRNSLWPQLDFVGTIKKNGLDLKFAKSIREISTEDNPEYIVGFEFSFPLENSEARAEFNQAELKKVRALVNLKKTEATIFIQVNDAVNKATTMNRAAKYQKEAMDLQESKYRAEESRFKKGRSDIDRLIRYQEDFLNAQIAYLLGVFEHKESLIDLKVKTAKLLKEVEA